MCFAVHVKSRIREFIASSTRVPICTPYVSRGFLLCSAILKYFSWIVDGPFWIPDNAASTALQEPHEVHQGFALPDVLPWQVVVECISAHGELHPDRLENGHLREAFQQE